MAPVDLVSLTRRQVTVVANPAQSKSSTTPKTIPWLHPSLPMSSCRSLPASKCPSGLTQPTTLRAGVMLRAIPKAQQSDTNPTKTPPSIQLTQLLPNQLRASKSAIAQRWRQHVNLLERLQTNGQIYLRMEAFYEVEQSEPLKSHEYNLLHAIEDLQQNIRELLQPGILIPAHRRNDAKGPEKDYHAFIYYLFALNLALAVRSKEVALQQGIAPLDSEA